MLKRKASHKPLRPRGKIGNKQATDRKVCKAEWDALDINYCVLQYEECWRTNDGYAHSLKRMNRTRPEHDFETVPGCSNCHLEKLERMGKEKMAAEVRRVRVSYGLPVWE